MLAEMYVPIGSVALPQSSERSPSLVKSTVSRVASAVAARENDRVHIDDVARKIAGLIGEGDPGDTVAAGQIVAVAARREDRGGAQQRAHSKAGAPEVAAALAAGLAGRLPGTMDS